MGKNLTIVVYKPDSQSTDEYIVYVNPVEYRKWKAGDTSIPLVDVVDSYSVFHTGQGTQGLQKKPSNQQLDTIFGTHKDVDVVEHILKHGKEQHSEIEPNVYNTQNATRGSAIVDSRGKGLTGI